MGPPSSREKAAAYGGGGQSLVIYANGIGRGCGERAVHGHEWHRNCYGERCGAAGSVCRSDSWLYPFISGERRDSSRRSFRARDSPYLPKRGLLSNTVKVALQ